MAKKEAKSTAVTPSTARGAVGRVIDTDEEMLKYVQRGQKLAEAAGSTGSWLTFKGGALKFRGQELADNRAELIVLDAVLENQFYEDAFDPDAPANPTCFAFGRELGEMKPHPTAPKPQHETCAGCLNNAWGSGDKGRGKACKNVNRLAVVPWSENMTGEQVRAAEIAFAKLPVTSVKNFAAYVNNLALKTNRPPFAFVTELAVERDAKTQFQVKFNMLHALDKKLLSDVFARVKEAEKVIVSDNPYPPVEREAPAPTGARGRPGRAPASSSKARKY